MRLETVVKVIAIVGKNVATKAISRLLLQLVGCAWPGSCPVNDWKTGPGRQCNV
jgi:hypothetical protein